MILSKPKSKPPAEQVSAEMSAPKFQPPKKKRKWPKRLAIVAVIAWRCFSFCAPAARARYSPCQGCT